MTSQKTPRMLEMEKTRGPIEKWLPELINAKGQGGAARELRVDRRTLRDWCLMLGLRFERRLVVPQDNQDVQPGP